MVRATLEIHAAVDRGRMLGPPPPSVFDPFIDLRSAARPGFDGSHATLRIRAAIGRGRMRGPSSALSLCPFIDLLIYSLSGLDGP
jgi:hypothetical protein